MQSPTISGYPRATWRLIVGDETDGATNMAVDEAILTAVTEGSSLPTLRFYAWSPPCLSLGRNQPLADADQEACLAAGVDIVRRPTGGRAILHTDELTYSILLPRSDPRATDDVVDCYRRLSEGLLVGLRRLGVEAIQATGQPGPASDPVAVCFETPTNYEIIAGGRKLVGSAQWRSRDGVLQHGTLPLYGGLTRVISYLAFPDEDRESRRRLLATRAVTLEEAIGCRLEFAQVVEALTEGFARALNLSFEPGGPTNKEQDLAAGLRRNRYAATHWTARV
jgi:lipoate-protein ligase A